MTRSERTWAVYVIFCCLPAQCVVLFPSFGLPLPPHLLWTLVPSPVPYQSPFGIEVYLYSGLVSPLTSIAQPLQHSAEKALFLTQSLCGVCVGLCMIEVCGSCCLRELLKLVWQARLCYADHPVSVISHLCNSAEWKYGMIRFLSPLLPLIYKWIHLVFMRGLLIGMAAGWSSSLSTQIVQSTVNKVIIQCKIFNKENMVLHIFGSCAADLSLCSCAFQLSSWMIEKYLSTDKKA